MKNKTFIILKTLIFIFINSLSLAENITIESKIVNFDKKEQKTIFTDNVVLKTEKNETIKSDYAEYDKLKGIIIFKDQVKFIDQENNIVETEYAEYSENKDVFQTK